MSNIPVKTKEDTKVINQKDTNLIQTLGSKLGIKKTNSLNDDIISNQRGSFDRFADRFLGEKKELTKYWNRVQAILDLEDEYSKLSDQDLKNKTSFFRSQLEGLDGKELEIKLNSLLPEAFATVREAAHRTIGQKHYPVQLIGGMVLHQGRIAEMKTGEGKTLVSTLSVYLNALPSLKQVHVVTVNDYLARRDASWMGQIYDFLGLSVGVIQNQSQFRFKLGASSDQIAKQKRIQGRVDTLEDGDMEAKTVLDVENLVPCSRMEAYTQFGDGKDVPIDIVYGVNSEFGFDYLRDNITQTKKEISQKWGFNTAVVDEVDSILIDEARTPLIISVPSMASSSRYKQFADIARRLTATVDYTVNEKEKSVTLTNQGIVHANELIGVKDLFLNPDNQTLVFHLLTALKAYTCFKREVEYVVKGSEVVIVDVSTGRMQFGRRFSEGLHQALEAKESLPVKEESQTAASVTYQNYFRMYSKLSGMTGTASTESEELFKTYKLLVVTIPTNRPINRIDKIDKIFKNENGKFIALVKDIEAIHKTGQPILVGTASIEKNELLSSMLQKLGLPFALLNAKNHEQEARIISEAGRLGAITIATNIAGRGVDIKLGGEKPEDPKQESSWRESKEKVKALGGLYVVGTERHESRRIDNQLRGRSGRQGDPGVSQFYISLNDELIRKFGNSQTAIYQSLPMADDEPIQISIIGRLVEAAQKKIESMNYDQRKHVMEYDDVINKQRQVIYTKRKKILTDDGFSYVDELQKTITRHIGHVLEKTNAISLRKIKKDPKILVSITKELNQIQPLVKFEVGQLSKTIVDNKKNLKKIIPELAKYTYEELNNRWGVYNSSLQKGMTRYIYLRALDNLWTEHLITLDYLADATRLIGYSQKTQLSEYKRDGMMIFQLLMKELDKEVCDTIFKMNPNLVSQEFLE
jgi:preprotein translocase subunit SecA